MARRQPDLGEQSPPARRSTRRRLPPERRREEILVAATQLLSTSGYNAISLDAFAAACGMTKAGLLHHFPSREALLTAVLAHRDALDQAAMHVGDREICADPASARALMTRVVARNAGQRPIIQLYTVLAAEALDPAHPAHEYFRRRLREGSALLREQLLSWHRHPDLAALELLAFLDGLQLNWLRDPAIDLLAQWESFADRFFRV